MNNTGYLDSYKQAAIEVIKSYWDFDYEDMCYCGMIIVEPNVLHTKDRVLDYCYVMDMLSNGKYSRSDNEDHDLILEYINLEDLVGQLNKEDLIQGLMNLQAIDEIEARYSQGLRLKTKIARELYCCDLYGIHTFVSHNAFMTIYPSTGKVEFSSYPPEVQEDCDCYKTEIFVKPGYEYDDPERNIFGGHQFREAPINFITRGELDDYI